MFYCISSCSFKLFYSLRCNYVFYCSSALILSTVSSIMTLFPTVYTSSISEPLLLLWSPLKCLSLMEFLVWPLLLWFLFIGTLTSRFPRPVIAICTLRFLCTAKIHWLWTSVPLSYCLLWCFFYWDLPNVSFIGLFSLVDSIVDFNYFVNQLPHIFRILHKY